MRTVWQVLNPFFIPVFFITAFALVLILLSQEKTYGKLLFVIVFSILIHSFFSIIFPAGDLSGQQMVLGRIRRVYDDTILHGWTGIPEQSIRVVIYEMFQGLNLQAALSTIFARMLSLDIFYVHLAFIPVLWGVFVPIAAFLTTRELGGSRNAAVLSSLVVSAFPYTVYFGAISVPNSLGFIFFFFSIFFMLRYLTHDDHKSMYLTALFIFFSFLSHYLTGIVSLAFLFLAVAFKTSRSEKPSSPYIYRISLTAIFLVSLSLLPLSLIYLRFFDPAATTAFSFEKLSELPLGQVIGQLLIGNAYSFSAENIFLLTIWPVIALLWMLYLLYQTRKSPMNRFSICVWFLFAAYLVVLIDYRILNLFMSDLPINEERLWVLRDFIAAPFVALAVYELVSLIKAKLAKTGNSLSLGLFSKSRILRLSVTFFIVDISISVLLAGWLTLSLGVAYPHVAPLQTTSYELDAVKYIQEHSSKRYVVIGDVWTIYAGEVIVGINNPTAYYFGEQSKLGHDFFINMTRDPSPQYMLSAMYLTDTQVAYFIITEPRFPDPKEFNSVVMRIQEPLQLFYKSENGKLYVYVYRT